MTGAPKDPRPDAGGGNGGLKGIDFGAIPFQLAISLLVGVFGGEWLDKKLGSAPWLLIAGVFLGAGLSFYSIYVKLMAAQAHDEAVQKSKRDAQP